MRPTCYGLKGLITAMLLTSLAACGGGGGSSAPAPDAPIPDAAIGGLWAGTVTDNVFNEAQFFLGVTTDDGRFRFLSADTLGQFVGTLDASGVTLRGSGVGIAPVGSTWLDNSTTINISMTGTISERASMSGTWSGGTGETGSFSFAYDGLYERGSSLSTVAGSWVSRDEFDNPIGSITIDSQGRMDAQDAAGCLYSGDLSIINASYNAYDLSLVVTNCAELNGTYSGLAVTADDTGTDDMLIYSVDNGTWFIIAEAHR